MSRLFAFVIFLIAFFETTQAQLQISNSISANDLVTKVLAGKNGNLIINNIRFIGSPQAIGSFRYKMEYNTLISSGIIISTGKVFDAIGPNTVQNMGVESYKFASRGDSDLNQLAHTDTYDAAVLEFDFMSNTDSISFNFFFASEEYPEYVNKNVNDIFGFFLIEKELGTKTNIALLPNSKTPISIDNVNSVKNSEYFIENAIWDADRLNLFTDNYALAERAYTLQFDGLTKVINVAARVNPNSMYTLKLAIADVGDDIFDTALFLEAESFKSTGRTNKTLPKELFAEMFPNQIADLNDSMLVLNYNITFAFDSDAFSGKESYSFLKRIADMLNYDKAIFVEIQGFTDNVGTNEYNLVLSENRAKKVMEYLISQGISSHRLRSIGFGNTKPLSKLKSDLNRRVEFVFYK